MPSRSDQTPRLRGVQVIDSLGKAWASGNDISGQQSLVAVDDHWPGVKDVYPCRRSKIAFEEVANGKVVLRKAVAYVREGVRVLPQSLR